MTGIFAGYSIIAQAQIDKITFPVAELGNCTSEEECKDYAHRGVPQCNGHRSIERRTHRFRSSAVTGEVP